MRTDLYAANHPARFWRLLEPEPAPEEWERASLAAASELPFEISRRSESMDSLLALTLGEGQFGPDHWSLNRSRRLYYRVKPALPRPLIVRLRRLHGSSVENGEPALGWPVEDRYARFLWAAARGAMELAGLSEVRFVYFWPWGHPFALVLTHDIETADGQAFVPVVADLEERLGLRSAFNFVAERYRVDRGLVRELQDRGFEVGIHGLKHDGRLFDSRREFERRAVRINEHLAALGAVGFRSPLTHRNPEWMQSLAVEYDCSFFDTDPFEPMPGGTMSLWPFMIGHFVELPYTLPQDFTLTEVLGERTPRIWLEKADFVARSHGMALLITHPDYLRDPAYLHMYEEFLESMCGRGGFWHALPRDVAAWWRRRVFGPGEAADWGLDAGMREGRLHIAGRRAEITVSFGAELERGARLASSQTELSQRLVT